MPGAEEWSHWTEELTAGHSLTDVGLDASYAGQVSIGCVFLPHCAMHSPLTPNPQHTGTGFPCDHGQRLV